MTTQGYERDDKTMQLPLALWSSTPMEKLHDLCLKPWVGILYIWSPSGHSIIRTSRWVFQIIHLKDSSRSELFYLEEHSSDVRWRWKVGRVVANQSLLLGGYTVSLPTFLLLVLRRVDGVRDECNRQAQIDNLATSSTSTSTQTRQKHARKE